MKKFIVYLTIVLIPLIYSLTYYTMSWVDCLALVAGLLIWSAAEYGFHRFAFHNDHLSPTAHKVLAYNHLQHHQFPNKEKDITLPFRLTLPLAGILFCVSLVFLPVPAAALFFTGMFIGLSLYEFVHYQAHHKLYNVWPLNYLTRRHMVHHYEHGDKIYGVTSPLFDWIFRTL